MGRKKGSMLNEYMWVELDAFSEIISCKITSILNSLSSLVEFCYFNWVFTECCESIIPVQLVWNTLCFTNDGGKSDSQLFYPSISQLCKVFFGHGSLCSTVHLPRFGSSCFLVFLSSLTALPHGLEVAFWPVWYSVPSDLSLFAGGVTLQTPFDLTVTRFQT